MPVTKRHGPHGMRGRKGCADTLRGSGRIPRHLAPHQKPCVMGELENQAGCWFGRFTRLTRNRSDGGQMGDWGLSVKRYLKRFAFTLTYQRKAKRVQRMAVLLRFAISCTSGLSRNALEFSELQQGMMRGGRREGPVRALSAIANLVPRDRQTAPGLAIG